MNIVFVVLPVHLRIHSFVHPFVNVNIKVCMLCKPFFYSGDGTGRVYARAIAHFP